MASVRFVRHAHLLVLSLSVVFSFPPSIVSAANNAVRCWRCGEIFTALEDATGLRCPACRAACRLSEDSGRLTLHCLESGSDSCAYILNCPNRTTVVFTGAGGGRGQLIVDYLKQLGTEEVSVLIGADRTKECMQSLVGIMKQCKVAQLFDPGFKNEGGIYADYLKALRAGEVNYRVARAMEDLSFGAVRLYLMRPSSFDMNSPNESSLSLCVVHSGNSFLLSQGLHGQAASFQQPRLLSAERVPLMLFKGASASLKAVGSPYRSGGPIVLESDGRGIGVRSLRQITVSSSRYDREAPAVHPVASSRTSRAAASPQGKININTASASELDELNGIGVKKAAAIIEYRKTHGPFRAIEDIKNVSGIGEKLFDRNKDRICVK